MFVCVCMYKFSSFLLCTKTKKGYLNETNRNLFPEINFLSVNIKFISSQKIFPICPKNCRYVKQLINKFIQKQIYLMKNLFPNEE